jgi:hypothetical protein
MAMSRFIERDDGESLKGLVVPVGILLLAREHEGDLEIVVVLQLPGVSQDDADAAAELQVVDEEGDLHSEVSAGPAPLGG